MLIETETVVSLDTAMGTAWKPTPDSELQKRKLKHRGPRARIACRQCRKRKVRCDIEPRGAPCTNCRLDAVDCVMCDRKKGFRREPPPGTPQALQQRTKTAIEAESRGASRETNDISQSTNQPSPVGIVTDNGHSFPSGGQGDATAQNELVREHVYVPDREIDSELVHQETVDPPQSVNPLGLPAYLGTEIMSLPTTKHQLVIDLPCYINYDLFNIPEVDFQYLSAKGCFTLPPKCAIDEFLKCYFDFVPPQLPILDEQEFLDSYQIVQEGEPSKSTTNQRKISLLLFQAVLFAASSYVSLSTLQKAGYTTRSGARRSLFHKVRALYSLDVEKDQIAVLQSLLLMSFWRGTPDDHKDAWHWSGLAISLASTIGLQSKPKAMLKERHQILHKRCWWSCVLRDRLLALSEHRRPRIRLEECDVPMLTLADFNVFLRSGLCELSAEEELGKRIALTMSVIQLIRLVICTNDIEQPTAEDAVTTPKTPMDTWARTVSYRNEDFVSTQCAALDSWWFNLPEVLQHTPGAGTEKATFPCVLLQRNALHMIYHKIILTIYIPRLLATTTGSQEFAKQLAHRSSLLISILYDELLDSELVQYLPREAFGPNAQNGGNLGFIAGGHITNWHDTPKMQYLQAEESSRPQTWGSSPTLLSSPVGNTSEKDDADRDDEENIAEGEQRQYISGSELGYPFGAGPDDLGAMDDVRSSDALSPFPVSLPNSSAIDPSYTFTLEPSIVMNFETLLSVGAVEII